MQNANVFIVAETNMFGDLIVAAVENAGHVASKRFDRFRPDIKLTGASALMAHLPADDEKLFETIKTLASTAENCPVVLLCPKGIVSQARQALGASVNAIIPDDKHLDVLMSALNVALNGLSVVHPSQLVNGTTKPQPRDPVDEGPSDKVLASLSERERVILGKVRDGFANKEIARQLEISDSTVKVHLRSIFQKTNVKNRTQAAMWANKVL